MKMVLRREVRKACRGGEGNFLTSCAYTRREVRPWGGRETLEHPTHTHLGNPKKSLKSKIARGA